MQLTPINNDVAVLKNLILDPGYPDREGFTDLDKRIERNKEFKVGSAKWQDEVSIVKALFYNLHEFKGQDISRFINYINRSKLDEQSVFDELLSFIGTDNGQQLKLLQKVELVKFLLSKRPDLVPLKIINEGLAELKTTNPWLFISLIDEKSNETAFELVKYFFHDKRFDKSVFFNIFMKWVGKPEPLFLQKVYREFLPLIKDDNFIKIMKHKLSADQINTIESETIEVNKIVERLNNPGNPELMIKADLYSWFQEREAGKPQLKVAKTVVIEPVPFVTGAVATLSGSFVKKIREYDSQTVKIAMAKVAGPEKKLVVVTRNGLVNHPKYKAFKRNSLNPA